MILNYENIKQFCEKFNDVSNRTDITLEEKQFMQFWKTELAMALVKDMGVDLSKEIANTMLFLCQQC